MQILVECYPKNVRRRRTRNLNLLYQVSPHIRSPQQSKLKTRCVLSQVMSHINSTLSHSRPLARSHYMDYRINYCTTYDCKPIAGDCSVLQYKVVNTHVRMALINPISRHICIMDRCTVALYESVLPYFTSFPTLFPMQLLPFGGPPQRFRCLQ